jgi:hypothetical protein
MWLERVMAALDSQRRDASPLAVIASDVPADLAEDWAEWLPAHALLVRCPAGGEAHGALLLAVTCPGRTGDSPAGRRSRRRLRPRLGGARRASHAALAPADAARAPGWRWRSQFWSFAAMWIPVRQSALAPAEIVPLEPTVVRAPLDGVVERIVVAAQSGHRGGRAPADARSDPDPQPPRRRPQGARRRRSRSTARPRNRPLSTRRAASSSPSCTAAPSSGRPTSPTPNRCWHASRSRPNEPGIAVFDDPNDWTGRPVRIGERILTIADPAKAEIEVRLPVADAIKPRTRAPEIALFLNIAPERRIEATLRYASYEATVRTDGALPTGSRRRWPAAQPPPRIGLRARRRSTASRFTSVLLPDAPAAGGAAAVRRASEWPRSPPRQKLARLLPDLREEIAVHPGPIARSTARRAGRCTTRRRNQFYRLGWREFEILSRWDCGSPTQLIARCKPRDDARRRARRRRRRRGAVPGAAQPVRQPQRRGHAQLLDKAARYRQHWATWLLKNYLFLRVPPVPARPLRSTASIRASPGCSRRRSATR